MLHIKLPFLATDHMNRLDVIPFLLHWGSYIDVFIKQRQFTVYSKWGARVRHGWLILTILKLWQEENHRNYVDLKTSKGQYQKWSLDESIRESRPPIQNIRSTYSQHERDPTNRNTDGSDIASALLPRILKRRVEWRLQWRRVSTVTPKKKLSLSCPSLNINKHTESRRLIESL